MSKRFSTLLTRYLAKTASEMEVAEFIELVREPENELHVRKLLEEQLKMDRRWPGTDKELEEDLQELLSKTVDRKSVSMRRVWMAAASLALIMVAGAWMYSRFSKVDLSNEQEQTTLTIEGRNYIPLPDGSAITLRDGGTITYDPKAYGVESREITLTGEAYFDVAHNPEKPFRVYTGKIVTTVLGTVFDINASAPDHITVSVTRGKVLVGSESRSFGTITPNEQMAVNGITEELVEKIQVDSQAVALWKKDYFILDRVTFAEAATLIGRRYKVKVMIANKSLNKCVISAWFLNDETLEQVVKAVSAFRQAKYTIANGNVRIEEGRGCD
jgi:transmembrane sensor